MNRINLRSFGVRTALCSVAGLALGSATANAQNLLTDLGPGSAYGINNSGQVVLSNGASPGGVNGIWSNGTEIAFPTGFYGAAINASGEVAGTFQGMAAFYSAGVVTSIAVDPDGPLCESAAFGLNDNGVVVGQGCGLGGAPLYAFIFNAGQITELLTFPGSAALNPPFPSEASAINNSGLVIGTAPVNTLSGQASIDGFIYDINSATWTDLGPGGGIAINASGQVLLGSSIYSNGTTTPIPIPGSAINTTGQVVGGNFFYSGGIIDLNALVSATDPLKPFVTLTNAAGINDNLLIAVNGVDSRTKLTHAYLVQAPWITISPGPLTFPSQAIGTVSSAQTLTVTDAGTTPLPIDSISISGDFLQTNNCGASLAPSGACAVMVTFGPTAGGARTGNLTVTTSGVPVTVPLAGTAPTPPPPPISVSIKASASTVMTGVPITLTWAASSGSTCVANGGAASISGAPKDGWTGPIATSGTQSVTESIAATFTYGLTCTAGSQNAQATTGPVIVTWPALTVSITASPTTITSGKSTTLTWTSANATMCQASGGGTDDGWAGTTRDPSGSAGITEPVVVASPLTLTYTLTCSNSGTGQSTPASVKVILNPPATSGGGGVTTASGTANSGGGGGALDLLSVLYLAGLAGLRRFRQNSFCD